MGLKLVLALAVLGFLAAALLLAWFQARMIYRFDQTPVTPETAGLEGWRVAEFPGADGTILRAWLRPPAKGAPVILYFTGNFTGPAQTARRLNAFAPAGPGFALLQYRGSGGAPGQPGEAVLQADALALYDALDGIAGETVAAERRILWGFSLGSGLALPLALERPAAGLILESAFGSLADYWAARYHLPPLRHLIWRERFDLTPLLPGVTMPVLLLRGAGDRAIPEASFAALSAAAPAGAGVRIYPQGSHADLLDKGAAPDAEAFISRVTPPR